MPDSKRYQDIYPEEPLVSSEKAQRQSASDLLTLEFFEAQPGEMPYLAYKQHHILLNLKEEPHRVENLRDGEHRQFIYHKNEIIVTPSGVKSGWKWFQKSKVIVITLEPVKLEKFAMRELGILLTDVQLKNIPKFIDEDITNAGIILLEALKSTNLGSEIIYESLARVFVVKLIQKYGLQKEEYEFSKSFTSESYNRVLEYVKTNYSKNITVEDLAEVAFLSPYHFSRLFKNTIGQTPHKFVTSYRLEQAKKQLSDLDRPIIDIAHSCGFSDQPHFTRLFKKSEGITPKQYRTSL